MKCISIQDWIKFTYLKDILKIEHAFPSGYNNVFKYTPELENYLQEKNIRYHVVQDKHELNERTRG